MKRHMGRDPNEVGAFAAKTNLAQLLDRVENGEVIVITRHGHPVARLVPITEDTDHERIGRAIDVLALADEHALTSYDACELELARRLRLPIGTLDGAGKRTGLKQAAMKCGIALFDAR
jgi:prevent-host-death family protein